MKKLKNLLFAGLLLITNLFSVSPVFADTNNFYFKDATFDYYLKKTATGSEMEVVETLTAEFPNYNQNHGIERVIPFLNQNDTNLTMESADHLSITVTRNGNSEPFTIKNYDTYFVVRIGNADEYVKGTQTYVLKYKFINVITDFSESHYSETPYQELYWDSNGTGWNQKFNSVTVNLHMDNDVKSDLISSLSVSDKTNYKNKANIHKNNLTKDSVAAWCYVGRYSSSDQDRCEITDINDGVSFHSSNLSGGENLTFVTNYKENSFIVPKNDYIKDLKFENISIDYYLSKDENSISKIKVKEQFDVLFPTANTMYKFNREIPFVNEARNSFTTKNQDTIDIKITFDGEEIEPTSYLDEYSDEGIFDISIRGLTDKYIHGKHTITYEYELENLISYDDELDRQKFSYMPIPEYAEYNIDNVKISLHLDDALGGNIKETLVADIEDEEHTLLAYCNDDKNELFSKNNCKTEKTDDGFAFITGNLEHKKNDADNLVIKVFFEDDTFTIPEPNRNYLVWHIFTTFVVIVGAITFLVIKKSYGSVKDKIKHYKETPIVAQYAPYKDLTVAVMGKNYLNLNPTRNLKVATMLELIVNKKIELRKEEKSKLFGKKLVWHAKLIDDKDLTNEQKDFLKILNNGKDFPSDGSEVEIKKHSYSSKLESAFGDYDRHVDNALYEKGLHATEETSIKTKKPLKSIAIAFGLIFLLNFGILVLIGLIFFGIKWYKETTNFTTFSIYEGKFLIPIMIIAAIIIFTALPIIASEASKYRKKTTKGLDVSRFTDGLKLYIKMAEAERIEFLQSVGHVDTTKEGIVKLYEKLLPYAALFGLEKSWMKELENYYELNKIDKPDWCKIGISTALSIAETVAHRPIDTSSSGWSSSSGSGGWSSSSHSSGGGGGGFSGGGGGGGGGGGW